MHAAKLPFVGPPPRGFLSHCAGAPLRLARLCLKSGSTDKELASKPLARSLRTLGCNARVPVNNRRPPTLLGFPAPLRSRPVTLPISTSNDPTRSYISTHATSSFSRPLV